MVPTLSLTYGVGPKVGDTTGMDLITGVPGPAGSTMESTRTGRVRGLTGGLTVVQTTSIHSQPEITA